jgi:methyltransferase (TIGR00027 family)
MTEQKNLVRDISDTALWVAYFRAKETERPDGLFRDPYAEKLSGAKGYEIAAKLPDGDKHEWAWVARTYLFDEFMAREIREGADLVINLAAGLDSRPYRMEMSPNLRWIEVDLPQLVAYKEEILANDKPKCRLERISLDLSDREARRALFAKWNSEAKKIAVMTEGLLIYFSPEEVASFSRDLAEGEHFVSWVIDLASPFQLKLMQQNMGKQLDQAGAPFKFGPAEGAEFFRPNGWVPKDVQGFLKTAAKFNRAPAELLSLLPEPKGPMTRYPWTGIARLQKQ